MSDVTALIDTYLAMWNETDPTARAEHIERAWASDGYYVDPLLEAEGHAALAEMAAGVQAKCPGHRFRRVSGIDRHHNELASDGRLRRITGFFGEIPQETAA
jgi:hypothetical protein